MKTLVRSTLIAAAIALLSATTAAADDPTCERASNGISFTTDTNRPYICNFDIDYPPFDTVDTYSDPNLRDHRWGQIRLYEDGSFHLPMILAENSMILFRGCGIPSWGCHPDESLELPERSYLCEPLPGQSHT